jgi:ribosomal protein S18 acetylase RimI-like enzyme
VIQPAVIRLVRPLGGTLPTPFWPPGVTLRTLTPKDAPRVHAVMSLAYANGYGSTPDYETWWATTRNDEEYDPELVFIAVDAEDRVLAFALVWNSAFIKDIVVHPNWQGRGLGSALLAEIFARLAERGYGTVALKVHPENAQAQRAYARMGFVADQ